MGATWSTRELGRACGAVAASAPVDATTAGSCSSVALWAEGDSATGLTTVAIGAGFSSASDIEIRDGSEEIRAGGISGEDDAWI